MTNVKIGGKTIAFPPGASKSSIEKKIMEIKLDMYKNLNKTLPKPQSKLKGKSKVTKKTV